VLQDARGQARRRARRTAREIGGFGTSEDDYRAPIWLVRYFFGSFDFVVNSSAKTLALEWAILSIIDL
jgi:hypothetical protein